MLIEHYFNIKLIAFCTSKTHSGYFHNEGAHFHNIC